MRSLEIESMNKGYYDLYSYVMANGEPFIHRGQSCIEVRPFSFTMASALNGLYTGVARRMNYRFWAAETLMYIAGWGKSHATMASQLLCILNSNYNNFSETVDGGGMILFPMVRYGDGFGQGIKRVYDTLQDKSQSRQAYISIWNTDTLHSYKNSPCLVGAQFFVNYPAPEGTEPKLSALFNIRSNDMNWGLPYDVAAFCAIQITLAGALGFSIGEYHHVAASMHFYEKGNGPCEPPNISPYGLEKFLRQPPVMPGPPNKQEIVGIQIVAEKILEAMHHHFVTMSAKPYDFTLGTLEEIRWVREWCDVIRWSWRTEGKR